mmetsp:Transcript_47725/g.91208  ORF Transcript_47725/g.91208 Transcript_47725/m.91208 type:complete len:218 (+) Transcript_47725:2128-2781(+)
MFIVHRDVRKDGLVPVVFKVEGAPLAWRQLLELGHDVAAVEGVAVDGQGAPRELLPGHGPQHGEERFGGAARLEGELHVAHVQTRELLAHTTHHAELLLRLFYNSNPNDVPLGEYQTIKHPKQHGPPCNVDHRLGDGEPSLFEAQPCTSYRNHYIDPRQFYFLVSSELLHSVHPMLVLLEAVKYTQSCKNRLCEESYVRWRSSETDSAILYLIHQER